jgi:hypothetical protein
MGKDAAKRLREVTPKPKDEDEPEVKKTDEPKSDESDQPKEETADENKTADSGKIKEKDPAAELLDRFLESEGRLKLTPEDLENIGGIDEFLKQLKRGAENLDPDLLRKLLEGIGGFGPDEFFASSMEALEPIARKTAGCTVEVLADDEPVALGTVVSEDGWILTKDTETQSGAITVRAGDFIVGASEIRRFPDHDLALFHIEAGDFRPVSWRESAGDPPLGSLLTVTNADDEPVGIGLVSVKSRALGKIGFLGVRAGEAENGVRAEQIVKDSPAAKAGLKQGDLMTKIDGKPIPDPIAFSQMIRGRHVGETVRIDLRRGDEDSHIEVKLGLRPERRVPDALKKMNRMSGPLSAKTSGFPQALQHDIPLPPELCGGPLLDLDGRCVGINVSRAGRVRTLAIPAGTVSSLLDRTRREIAAKEQSPGSGETAEPAISAKELEEMQQTLEKIQATLEELRQRLEKAEAR